jgi:D-alanine-D-alanine ligase
VIRNLDPATYEVVPVSIDHQGRFHLHELSVALESSRASLPVGSEGHALTLAPQPSAALFYQSAAPLPVDVIFPVMHGPLCEDGCIQGLFELADVAYVGSRVLGSALCMDKDVAKRLVRAEGVGIADYVCFEGPAWQSQAAALTQRMESELGYPVFVKPATLGSSVGVTRVTDRAQLTTAVTHALGYDDKVLVERAVDAREIEVAVLAATDPAALPEASTPGEIVPREAFYSFERKYVESAGADLHVPAKIDTAVSEQVRSFAQRIFLALQCQGMARIDFFLDRKTGKLLFNEANTIPGFTAISMYPKLWQASGLPYATLLDRLIRDALSRHARRSRLRRQR